MKKLVEFALGNGGSDSVIPIPSKYKFYNGVASINPTITDFKDNLFLNSRVVNYYKIYSTEKFPILPSDWSNQIVQSNNGYLMSENVIQVPGLKKEVEYDIPFYFNSNYNGLEDARFVVWDNKMYIYGTRFDVVEDKGIIVIYELNDNLEICTVINVFNEDTYIEKNWMAIPDKPFHFVYDCNISQVVKVDRNTGNYETVKTGEWHGKEYQLRGNTPLSRLDDNTYVTVVHTSYNEDNEDINYKFKFLFYDNNFNVIKSSDWFVFKNEMCEFCCGMNIINNEINIAYSILDCDSFIVSFPIDKLNEFCFETNETDTVFDTLYFYKLAELNEKQMKPAIPLYNYVACITEPYEKIHYECAVKTLAYWSNNEYIFSECIDNFEMLALKYTKLFPECCEAYYILAKIYRYQGLLEEAKKVKKRGDKFKFNIIPYFTTYLNYEYL